MFIIQTCKLFQLFNPVVLVFGAQLMSQNQTDQYLFGKTYSTIRVVFFSFSLSLDTNLTCRFYFLFFTKCSWDYLERNTQMISLDGKWFKSERTILGFRQVNVGFSVSQYRVRLYSIADNELTERMLLSAMISKIDSFQFVLLWSLSIDWLIYDTFVSNTKTPDWHSVCSRL